MSMFDVNNIPRYGLYHGRRVRITNYDPDGQLFQIVLPNDSTTWVQRKMITFIKGVMK